MSLRIMPALSNRDQIHLNWWNSYSDSSKNTNFPEFFQIARSIRNLPRIILQRSLVSSPLEMGNNYGKALG